MNYLKIYLEIFNFPKAIRVMEFKFIHDKINNLIDCLTFKFFPHFNILQYHRLLLKHRLTVLHRFFSFLLLLLHPVKQHWIICLGSFCSCCEFLLVFHFSSRCVHKGKSRKENCCVPSKIESTIFVMFLSNHIAVYCCDHKSNGVWLTRDLRKKYRVK